MKFFKSLLASILGSIIAGVILVLIVMAIFGSLLTPKQPTLDVKDKAFLSMTFGNPITERSDENPFRSSGLSLPEFGSTDGLYEIREALRKAADDSRIAGIYLRIRGVEAGWATVASIRDGLEEFKASGKPIYAWSDQWSEKPLHLAGVADEIYLHPVGAVGLNGFASTPMFYKGMFDKVGIEPKVFKVGTFKSAVEPYKDYQMSEPNREQISTLLFDLWNEFRDSLALARTDLSPNQIDSLTSQGLILTRPELAVQSGVIDGLAYENDVHELLKEELELESGGELEMVSLSKYISARVRSKNLKKSSPKVAVLFMEGTIVDGKGNNGEIGGDAFVKELRKVRDDSTVKAVVLRINSPGGSALASDLMWAEIESVKKKKPVIASMGDVAASGGYYISAPCDYIFARPSTITGSIGVFSLMFNTEALYEEQLGISFDRVATHPLADLGNTNREMTSQEEAVMQEGVNRIYSRFIDIVRTGRGFKDSVEVDKIAQGRVWSGQRALELGLVDELGGLDAAVAFAKEKAGLSDNEETQLMLLPEAVDPFERIAQSLGQAQFDLDAFGPELKKRIEEVRQAAQLRPGNYMLMPVQLDIE